MPRKKPPDRPIAQPATARMPRRQLIDVLRQLNADLPKCASAEADFQIRMRQVREVCSDIVDGRMVVISRGMLRRIIVELEAA